MAAVPDTLDALAQSGALDELPSIADAKLPAVYESARHALTECSRIDECMQWANKTEALASYAKQAGDDSLRKLADRIQARAIRRCGELLRQIASAQGQRTDQLQEGAHPKLSRAQAATDAGLSEHQRKTALRVAAVPAEEFEQQVESANPPTVTQLAEQGRKPRVVFDLGGRSPEDFAAATQAIGALQRLAQFCDSHDPARVAAGLSSGDLDGLYSSLSSVGQWIDALVIELAKE